MRAVRGWAGTPPRAMQTASAPVQRARRARKKKARTSAACGALSATPAGHLARACPRPPHHHPLSPNVMRTHMWRCLAARGARAAATCTDDIMTTFCHASLNFVGASVSASCSRRPCPGGGLAGGRAGGRWVRLVGEIGRPERVERVSKRSERWVALHEHITDMTRRGSLGIVDAAGGHLHFSWLLNCCLQQSPLQSPD